MRIYLKISPNKVPVPFNYQQKLVGVIHKWIGNNRIHDSISLYSFSWLNGGKKVDNALDFSNGATMFISFHNNDVIKTIIRSILDNPDMFCGMSVEDITISRYPNLSKRELYYCASPIFIKRTLTDDNIKQYVFNDSEANSLLKETLETKMKAAGIEKDETLDIQFDVAYLKKRLKLINYHGINNKASLCPVIIKAKEETKRFIWDVGLGNCTGIGFGAVK